MTFAPLVRVVEDADVPEPVVTVHVAPGPEVRIVDGACEDVSVPLRVS